MRKYGSIRLLLNLGAVLTLCLCLLATAAGAEGLADSAKTGNVEAGDVQTGDVESGNAETGNAETETTQAQPGEPTAAAPVLFAEEQAIALVKDSLKADDAWQIISAGMADNAGVPCYRIVAIDPLGDAHSRLVNAQTGEITVENLWSAVPQDAEQQQEGEHQTGEQDEDGQQSETDDQDESVEQQNNDADNDTTENQQEGEFDTADELGSGATDTTGKDVGRPLF